MMRAVVCGDKILDISEKKGTVEIGTPPAGVGLERLRWTGTELIDLANLSQIWVRHLGGDAYELHASEQSGSQLVTMTYQNRKSLMVEDGIIRLKTTEEIEEEKTEIDIHMLKNRLRKRLQGNNGDVSDQIADAFKLIFMLIIYIRTEPRILADFFDSIIPTIEDVYDLDTVKTKLIGICQQLKAELPAYYQQKESMNILQTEAIILKK